MNKNNPEGNRDHPFYLWLFTAAIVLLSACTILPTSQPLESNVVTNSSPQEVVNTQTPLASKTPLSTAFPTETILVPDTVTSTMAPTKTLHPMMIEALREQEYPGSDIIIEKVLDPGVNYYHYYASYLSEGLRIYALMTIPNGEPPETGWPVIVFNHGYIQPDQYRTTERYLAYVDRLAQSGYIVFRSDYRGHDQSEGDAGGAYSDPGYVIDILNAIASLKRYPVADPNRIGMWGHSMGGYITLRAMVVSPDIKAGVIWAGVVGAYPDLFARGLEFSTTALTSTPFPGRRWQISWIEQFGSFADNPEFWNSISANAYLTDLPGPLQLHHGTGDTHVPLSTSQTLYEQMLEGGMPVEYYTYEGDDHNISGFFTLAMNRTIEFFDLYVKQ